jgi:hypothetical protein
MASPSLILMDFSGFVTAKEFCRHGGQEADGAFVKVIGLHQQEGGKKICLSKAKIYIY